jgi:tropomyosin
MEKIKEVPCTLCIRARSWHGPQRLALLRTDADTAHARAEAAEAKNKAYEQTLLERENDITSLNRKIAALEQERDRWEKKHEVRASCARARSGVDRAPQESEAKYRQSQAELDALVSGLWDIVWLGF